MKEDLYCKLFVNTEVDIDQLKDRIVMMVSGEKHLFRTVVTTFGEIDVNKNEDYDKMKVTQPDGFLHFKYYLDIEPNEAVAQQDYIEGVANLLQNLWDNDFKAVAACDFEEELPEKGGYSDLK